MLLEVLGFESSGYIKKNTTDIYLLVIKNEGRHSLVEINNNIRFGMRYFYYSNDRKKIFYIEFIDLLYRDSFIKTVGFDNFSLDDPLLCV